MSIEKILCSVRCVFCFFFKIISQQNVKHLPTKNVFNVGVEEAQSSKNGGQFLSTLKLAIVFYDPFKKYENRVRNGRINNHFEVNER